MSSAHDSTVRPSVSWWICPWSLEVKSRRRQQQTNKKQRQKFIAYPQPLRTRCRPIFVHTFDCSHVMAITRYRIIGWIVAIVSCHQNACVAVDAKEIGSVANAIDFMRCELWQAGSFEALLLRHGWDSVDHHLRIVSVFRENWMCEPTELFFGERYKLSEWISFCESSKWRKSCKTHIQFRITCDDAFVCHRLA